MQKPIAKTDLRHVRRQDVLSRLKKYWPLYILLLPAVIYVFIFSYVPMQGVVMAFKNYRTNLGIWGSEWVSLKHFKRFIEYPNFWPIMNNTLRIGLYALATFPCSVILALLLNELNNRKFQKTMQMITYAPYFLSTVVVCSMIMLFMDKNTGVINNLMEMIGLKRISFMTTDYMFDDIYVWSSVWQTMGWGSIVYLAALSGVSPDLVEAAKIDGASRFQIMWHVNLPCILPTVIIMLILSCGNVLSVGFEKTYLLQNSLNLSYSQVISTYVYEVGLKSTQFSYASAIGLFNTVINVTLLLVINKIAKEISSISLL